MYGRLCCVLLVDDRLGWREKVDGAGGYGSSRAEDDGGGRVGRRRWSDGGSSEVSDGGGRNPRVSVDEGGEDGGSGDGGGGEDGGGRQVEDGGGRADGAMMEAAGRRPRVSTAAVDARCDGLCEGWRGLRGLIWRVLPLEITI